VLCSDIQCTIGSGCNSHVPAREHAANRPIAHHVLDALLASGADQLVIAGMPDVLIDVRACLSRHGSGPVRLDYAVCDEADGPIGVSRAPAAPLRRRRSPPHQPVLPELHRGCPHTRLHDTRGRRAARDRIAPACSWIHHRLRGRALIEGLAAEARTVDRRAGQLGHARTAHHNQMISKLLIAAQPMLQLRPVGSQRPKGSRLVAILERGVLQAKPRLDWRSAWVR
jgi:hypothetical protein